MSSNVRKGLIPGFDRKSFDRKIRSLIFPGNKATDQNKFDNCEEYEHLN